MHIFSIEKQPNFKQIKLSEAELKKAQSKYSYMLKKPENPVISYFVFDIFEPHLNKEVELKQYKTGKERRYFSTNLYVKFFEILDCMKTKELPFEEVITHLNDYIEKFNIKRSPEIDSPKLQDYNVTSAKRAAANMYTYLNMPRKEFLKLAQTHNFFPNSSGKTLKVIAEKLSSTFGFTEEECIDIFKRNPVSMTHHSDCLVEKANKIIETLDVESLEDFRAIIKSNPNLLTYEYLDDSIKNIAEFLDTDENNVKMIFKTKPYIATMKFEYFKANFYSMKNLINVNREKMAEITIMSPITVSLPFELNKNKYEKIAKTLKILPETFYNKANSIPAMYRITDRRLEDFIDFISNKLDYTREETIDYIAKNLNILSYRYNNMVERTENNFNILNEELDIDYNMYLYFLEENAWILGQKEDLLRKQMKDVEEYFNVEKDVKKRMIEDNPQLVTYYIENVDKDITNASEYFNIDKEEFKQMCIIEPLLATKPIKLHQIDISENARILGLSEEEYIDFGKKHPEFLAYNPNQVLELKEQMKII